MPSIKDVASIRSMTKKKKNQCCVIHLIRTRWQRVSQGLEKKYLAAKFPWEVQNQILIPVFFFFFLSHFLSLTPSGSQELMKCFEAPKREQKHIS